MASGWRHRRIQFRSRPCGSASRRVGIPADRGIFTEFVRMEFVQGVPLLDAPLDDESRRDSARLVSRRLVLDSLFSGLPHSIFMAAQPSPPAQSLPDAGGNYAPTRPRFHHAWPETLADASEAFATESRRANLEHSISVPRPARFLSFRVAHANAPQPISRG